MDWQQGRDGSGRYQANRPSSGPSVAAAGQTLTVAAELDRVDALPVGAGQLDLFGWMRGTDVRGSAGLGIDYSHRLSERLSAFARGTLSHEWVPFGRHWEAQALAGLRMRF